MRPINPVINDFFGGIQAKYSLNVLLPLNCILNADSNDDQIEKILESIPSAISLFDFKQMVNDEVSYLSSELEAHPYLLANKPVSGKNLSALKKYTVLWGYHAIYWGYNFGDGKNTYMRSVHDPKIVNIALKYNEYYLRMKNQEVQTNADKHISSFYEFIATGNARAIEFLAAASKQCHSHLSEKYFAKSIDDLAQNFFHVQNNNIWESNYLYVIDTPKRKLMRYDNEDEGITFQVLSSRTLKDGSLDSFDDAEYKSIQLYKLESTVHSSRYTSRIRKKSTTTVDKKIRYVVEELEKDLIHILIDTPRSMPIEESLELKSKSVRRRDNGEDLNCSSEENEVPMIRSAYFQSLKNKAISAKITKNAIVLPSDYNIPPFELLSDFISFMPFNTYEQKLHKSLLILTTSLGCKLGDAIDMVRNDDDAIFKYKDGSITVKLDQSIFASTQLTEYTKSSKKSIVFNVSTMADQLIAYTKSLLDQNTEDKESLFSRHKVHVKELSKKYPKHISVKADQTYRYLKLYAKEKKADMLTLLLSCGTYTQNDTAKLAYTSTRENSVSQSKLVIDFWNTLQFNDIVSVMLNSTSTITTSLSHHVSKPIYAGSSKGVNPFHSRKFFRTIHQNIEKYTSLGDRDTVFNLASIGTRYAMSLLLGTRGFKNSASFDSCSYDLGLLVINEKSQHIASGVRVIPLCSTIISLLRNYEMVHLYHKSLERGIWLIEDGVTQSFNRKLAADILKSIPDLENRDNLEKYVEYVHLNTGRHCFTQKALELSVDVDHISAYMGHNFAGAEQFGIYSTLNVTSYANAIKYVTQTLASEHGIKDLLW